jgi:hypothetical protein
MPPKEATTSVESFHGHSSKVHYSAVPKQEAPATIEQIESVMLKMDEIHQTSFSPWICDPKNLDYLCAIKGELFMTFYLKDSRQALTALKWLSKSWITINVAALLLKLFRHHDFASATFVEAVYFITNEWHVDKIVDLTSIILIGESEESVARYIDIWLRFR